MTMLQIMPASDGTQALLRTSDAARIAEELGPHGIRFERWNAEVPLAAGAGESEVLEAYRDDIARLRAQGGFRLVDVVRMNPDGSDPAWPAAAKAAREKFLEEHTHDEDEVRFFVEGTGCFYLHLAERVYAVVCEAGDLLSVPAGTRHWFDMGTWPQFTAIRFFQEEDGWVAAFTGDLIGRAMPSLDDLLTRTRP